MYKSNKFFNKFVAKLLKYIQDPGHTYIFRTFDYDIVLCFPRNHYSKIEMNWIIISQKNFLKINVLKLSKSYMLRTDRQIDRPKLYKRFAFHNW